VWQVSKPSLNAKLQRGGCYTAVQKGTLEH